MSQTRAYSILGPEKNWPGQLQTMIARYTELEKVAPNSGTVRTGMAVHLPSESITWKEELTYPGWGVVWLCYDPTVVGDDVSKMVTAPSYDEFEDIFR